MKNQKMYESGDRMISLIRDNYDLLQVLGRFGINLGFGDKTVGEVCEGQGVDTYTFLAIVNFTINGYRDIDDDERISLSTLLYYLKSSHEYYLNFELPFIRKELIIKIYDEYALFVNDHMAYEEKNLFPYVESLLKGEVADNYDIDTFSKHHDQVAVKLRELKNIILKYLPSDIRHNNQLTATLYDIYNSENWLSQHSEIEERIFIPAIRKLEGKAKQKDVSLNISNMLSQAACSDENLSEREKDVVVGVVQGMSNKEIADHLFISVNTVITHRRNIARKLQIHSPAGLTIYAIVNKLVDISSVKL